MPESTDIVVLRNPIGRDFRRKLSILASLYYYMSTIARHAARADCVHVPPPGDIPLLGMLVGLALRKRLIVRYGGSWATTSRTTLTNRATRALMRIFAGGRNVMLATGEGQMAPAPGISWIFSTGLSEQELARVRPVTDRGLSAPPQLAYVGRLSVEKGLQNLIQAIADLEREGLTPVPELTIIGDGPERGRLRDLSVKLGHENRIRFTGQLNRAALSAALSHADFCVQPSLSEGYSKAWLDAFAHGLPVLSSEVGAARTVIGAAGERGWLVPPGDLEMLVAQLRRVLKESRDWRALRRRCRSFAESRTLEVWAAQIGRLCANQWKLRFEEGKLVA